MKERCSVAGKEKRCGNCEFYHTEDQGGDAGQCRFNAPLPTLKSAMMSEKFFKEAALTWPNVKPGDWCGQYKEKKP